MENLENNKLIAEFLGLEKFKDLLATIHNGKINISIDIYEQSKFDTDWNWLMEVVEKIRVTEKCNDFNINYSCDVKIECEDYDKVFEVYTSNTINTLQAVYEACIEFIKWYNENK